MRAMRTMVLSNVHMSLYVFLFVSFPLLPVLWVKAQALALTIKTLCICIYIFAGAVGASSTRQNSSSSSSISHFANCRPPTLLFSYSYLVFFCLFALSHSFPQVRNPQWAIQYVRYPTQPETQTFHWVKRRKR